MTKESIEREIDDIMVVCYDCNYTSCVGCNLQDELMELEGRLNRIE